MPWGFAAGLDHRASQWNQFSPCKTEARAELAWSNRRLDPTLLKAMGVLVSEHLRQNITAVALM